jgi:hypothetical protein
MQKRLLNPCISAFLMPLFLLILWVSTTEKAVAQTSSRVEGYYLDLKSDTVRGLFNFDDLEQNRVAFYPDKTTDNYATLRPNDVKAIHAVDKTMLTTFNYGYAKSLFLRTLFSEKITLYKTYFEDEGMVFFINTLTNPDIVKIEKDKATLFFDGYFNTCKLDKNIDVKYTETSLLSAVSMLNKCADLEKKKVFVSEQTRFIRQFSVSLGAFFTSFAGKPVIVDGVYGGTYQALETTSRFGVMGVLNCPYNIHLKIGLNKFSKNIVNPDSVITSVYTTQYRGARFYYKAPIEFKYDALEIPIELAYHFKFISPRITPMLSVGMSFVMLGKPTIVKDFPTNYYKYETTELLPLSWYTIPAGPNLSTFTTNQLSQSFFISGGLNVSLNKHSAIELSVRQVNDKDTFVSDAGETIINTKRTEFAIGYLYTFKK